MFELKLQLHGCPWGVGAKTGTRIAFEKEYNQVPEGDALKVIGLPFNTNSVAVSQNTTNPATITGNRNPVEPIYGNNDVTGDIAVPLDYTAFGYWLTAAFGFPVTTALENGKYQHVFKVQNDQPSFVLEKAFPGITQYIRSHGCKVSQLSFSAGGDGELVATVSVMGAKEDIAQLPLSETITAPAMDRAQNFQVGLNVGGQAAGKGLTFSLDIEMGLDGDSFTIGSGGYREAICEGILTISGTMEAFFKDGTYLEMAEKSQETSLELIIKQGEDYSLSILIPEVKFARTSPAIDGPAGIKQNLSFNGYYKDSEEQSAVVITLVNKYSNYDVFNSLEDNVTVAVPSGDVYGKPVTDMAENLVITADGKATGILKHVTDFTGFNDTVVEEQSGYFLPFIATFPEGTTSATMQVVGGSGNKVNILGETYNVARLGATEEEAKSRSVVIEYSNDEMTKALTIDVTGLTYIAE